MKDDVLKFIDDRIKVQESIMETAKGFTDPKGGIIFLVAENAVGDLKKIRFMIHAGQLK